MIAFQAAAAMPALLASVVGTIQYHLPRHGRDAAAPALAMVPAQIVCTVNSGMGRISSPIPAAITAALHASMRACAFCLFR